MNTTDTPSQNMTARCSYFIATGCYLGHSHVAPGTVGTMLALPIAYGLAQTSSIVAIMIYSMLCVIGYISIHITETHHRHPDPSYIVIDEICGFAIIFLWLDASALSLGIGFALFRFFDITKPGPVGWSERILRHRPIGTLIDDLIAGMLSTCCLKILAFWQII